MYALHKHTSVMPQNYIGRLTGFESLNKSRSFYSPLLSARHQWFKTSSSASIDPDLFCISDCNSPFRALRQKFLTLLMSVKYYCSCTIFSQPVNRRGAIQLHSSVKVSVCQRLQLIKMCCTVILDFKFTLLTLILFLICIPFFGNPRPFPNLDFRSKSLVLGLVGAVFAPLIMSPVSLRESPRPESRDEFFLSLLLALALRRASWILVLEEESQLPLGSFFIFLLATLPLSSSPDKNESLRSLASTGFAFSHDWQSAAMFTIFATNWGQEQNFVCTCDIKNICQSKHGSRTWPDKLWNSKSCPPPFHSNSDVLVNKS